MVEKIGRFLPKMRIKEVLPHIEGHLHDIGYGINEYVKLYPERVIGQATMQKKRNYKD